MQTPSSCLETGDHCFERCLIFLTVVPPEAMASYAQELDEIVEALFPLFVGQDWLEPHTFKRMRLPRNAGGFDAAPVLLRSPMAFLAPSVAKAAGVRATEGTRRGSWVYRWTKGGCREQATLQTERWTLPVWATKH